MDMVLTTLLVIGWGASLFEIVILLVKLRTDDTVRNGDAVLAVCGALFLIWRIFGNIF